MSNVTVQDIDTILKSKKESDSSSVTVQDIDAILKSKKESGSSSGLRPYASMVGSDAVKKSWDALNAGLDVVSDISRAVPSGLLKGASQIGDFASYPVRKPLEQLLNREIPTLEEGAAPSYKPTTGVGRVAQKGAEYTGSMLGGAGAGSTLAKAGISAAPKIVSKTAPLLERGLTKVRNFITNPAELLGNPKNIKEAAELGKAGASAGLISGSAQELGADSLTGDLIAVGGSLGPSVFKTMGNRSAYKKSINSPETKALLDLESQVGSKNIDKIFNNLSKSPKSPLKGYSPTTAENANNTALSQVYRAFKGHSPELADVEEKGSQVIRQALEDLIPKKETSFDLLKGKYNPEATGEPIRKGLEFELEARKRLRRQKSEPLYKAADLLESPAHADSANKFITETINDVGVKEPIKNDFLSIKQSLMPNKLTNDQKKLVTEIEKSAHPDWAKQQALEQIGLPNGTALTPRELNNVRKVIDKKITLSRKSGDQERAYYLSELKENVLKDLDPFPEVAKANKAYRDYSKPVNKIEGDRALSKVLEKDIYKQDYKIGAAEIPDLFTKSTKSIQNANNLMAALKRDKESKQALQDHLYSDFYNHVINANGDVKLSSIESWMKNHPGASIIDPKFKDKAMEGLQKAFLSDISNKTKLSSVNASGEHNVSFDKMRKYLHSQRGFLKDSLTKDQSKQLENIEKVLKKRSQVASVGSTVNSATKSYDVLVKNLLKDTGEKVSETAFKSFLDTVSSSPSFAGHAVKGLREIKKNIKEIKINKQKEFLHKFLADPKEAKEMLSRYKSLPEKSPRFKASDSDKKLLQILGIKNLSRNP